MKTDQLFELLKENPEFMREAERYKDKIFQAVFLGEQAGFETGLSWGIQLTAESRLISES